MDHTTPVLEVLRSELPATPIAEGTATDTPTIGVDREHIVDTLRVLRDHALLQFAFLVDVIGVDYHPATPRYEIVYHLACLGPAFAHGPAAPPRRLRVKVRVPGDDPVIASIVPVFRSANWPEREIFDLFGIHFEGHPDLRRILMPEDWEGYPLRKDYPVQIRKDAESWSPAQLTAEEFAENIRAQRARASRDSHAGPKDAGGGR